MGHSEEKIEQEIARLRGVTPIEPPPFTEEERRALKRLSAMTLRGAIFFVTLLVLLIAALVAHLVFNQWMLYPQGRFYWFTAVFLYGAVAWSLVLMLATLLFGVFAKDVFDFKGVEIKRKHAPQLFDFVEAVCERVQVPPPSKIYLINSVNAYVKGEGLGLRAILTNRLTVTMGIGLPLLNGGKLTHLADIIAHEAGHYANDSHFVSSMRSGIIYNYMMRSLVSRKFLDVTIMLSYGLALSMPLYMGLLWAYRQISVGLYTRWEELKNRQSQLAELSADYYSARLVGGEVVEQSFMRLEDLTHITQYIPSVVLAHYYQTGRVPADLGRLTAKILDSGALTYETAEHKRRGTIFPPDRYLTHPVHNKRIKRALEIAPEGMFESDVPAFALLTPAFTERASILAQKFYEKELRISVDRGEFMATEISDAIIEELSLFRASRRFFMGHLAPKHGGRPALPGRETAPLTELHAALVKVRERLKFKAKPHMSRLDEYDEKEQKLVATELELISERYDAALSPRGLDDLAEAIARHKRELEMELSRLESTNLPFERMLFERANLVLRVLFHERFLREHPQFNDRARRMETIMPLLVTFEHLRDLLGDFRYRYLVFARICSVLPGNEHNGPLAKAFMGHYEAIREIMERLLGKLRGKKIPLELAGGSRTFDEWLGATIPHEKEYEQTIAASHTFLQRLVLVRERLYSELALCCEQVEAALSLEPLYDGQEHLPVPPLFSTVPQLTL